MGGVITSTAQPVPVPVIKSDGRLSTDQAVSLVLPIYYSKEPLTTQERDEAIGAWKLIFNNKAPAFVELKSKDPSFPHALCTEYFYSIFFVRLIDVYSHAKGLFSKSNQRMRQSFLGSLSMIINLIDDPTKFNRVLVNLAHVHNKIGVKSMEYGIVGEVIIYSLTKCVGDQTMTHAARRGWSKLLSRLLDVILPVVVTYEVENREAVQAQYAARLSAAMSRAGSAATLGAGSMKEHYVSSPTLSFMDGQSFGGQSDFQLINSRYPSMGTVKMWEDKEEEEVAKP